MSFLAMRWTLPLRTRLVNGIASQHFFDRAGSSAPGCLDEPPDICLHFIFLLQSTLNWVVFGNQRFKALKEFVAIMSGRIFFFWVYFFMAINAQRCWTYLPSFSLQCIFLGLHPDRRCRQGQTEVPCPSSKGCLHWYFNFFDNLWCNIFSLTSLILDGRRKLSMWKHYTMHYTIIFSLWQF